MDTEKPITIERLIELTKEPSYRLPRGMNRTERRMFCKFASSVLGWNKKKAAE